MEKSAQHGNIHYSILYKIPRARYLNCVSYLERFAKLVTFPTCLRLSYSYFRIIYFHLRFFINSLRGRGFSKDDSGMTL